MPIVEGPKLEFAAEDPRGAYLTRMRLLRNGDRWEPRDRHRENIELDDTLR